MSGKHRSGTRKQIAALEAPRCQFTRENGRRCGSPALKGRAFCYFHSRTADGRKRTRGRGDRVKSLEFPVLTDERAIGIAATSICRALLEKTVDPRRAKTVLYGLQVARSLLTPDRCGE